MKLSYYMRGLGTGIVVTALIMGIAMRNSNAPALTDAEIKAAAEKLGMVESSSLKLSDLSSASDEGNPGESGSSGSGENGGESSRPGSPQESGSSESEESKSPESGESGGESSRPGSPEESGSSESGESGGESFRPGSPEESESPGAGESGGESPEIVTVTVNRGTGSRAICNRLEELGLIENAREFDQYLIDNGYSKRISVGTYEIETGADWETIAKIITKSR